MPSGGLLGRRRKLALGSAGSRDPWRFIRDLADRHLVELSVAQLSEFYASRAHAAGVSYGRRKPRRT
jgi:hypothetical protein